MRIVRYIVRDPEGNSYQSHEAYIWHGKTVHSGADILENPETGSLFSVSVPIIDVEFTFSRSVQATIDAAETR